MTDIPQDLSNLVEELLSWATSMPSIRIFIYGSRVRGDHRPHSDVDIHFDTDDATTCDRLSLFAQETDDTFEVPERWQKRLVGDATKHWPELRERVREARVIYQKENIICVWLPPKPSSANE